MFSCQACSLPSCGHRMFQNETKPFGALLDWSKRNGLAYKSCRISSLYIKGLLSEPKLLS